MTAYPGLTYTLCAFLAAAILFNLLLLLWHCFRFPSRGTVRLLKYAVGLLHVAYLVLATSVVLMVLRLDIPQQWFCTMIGFLLLYSAQVALWTMAACTIVMLLWQRNQMPWKRGWLANYQEHKWRLPIFLLSMFLACVVLAIVVFLPLLNLDFFDSSTPFYYPCVHMRFPEERGWVYSAAVLSSMWLALLIASTCVLYTMVTTRRTRQSLLAFCSPGAGTGGTSLHQDLSEAWNLAWRTSITICCNIFFWLVLLLCFTVSFVSSGRLLERLYLQWVLGFLAGVTCLAHPVVSLVLALAGNRRCCGRLREPLTKDNATPYGPGLDCPKSLLGLSKLPGKQEIKQYLVQWIDDKPTRPVVNGVLKVFHPSVSHKWQNEMNAACKLLGVEHPNIARYHWGSPKNRFNSAICTFTADIVGQETSVLCRQHYPLGSLQRYLETSVGKLSEIGLHKIAQDLANGLGHLHQLHLVHNNLSTNTVYMTSVAEDLGVRVVIADFEESYTVSPDTLRKSPLTVGQFTSAYCVSKQLDMDNSRFSPDIRALSLVVLEMIVTLNSHKYSRSLEERSSMPMEDITAQLSSDAGVRENPPSPCKCTCSSKVTEVRAFVEKDHSRRAKTEACSDVTSSWLSQGPLKSVVPSVSGRPRPTPGNRQEVASVDVPDVFNGKTNTRTRSSTTATAVKSIQQRPLPGIPTANSSTTHVSSEPRSRLPVCFSANSSLDTKDVPLVTGRGGHSCDKITLKDFSPGQSSSDLEPLSSPDSSEQVHSGSIASLGSFETIYEDDGDMVDSPGHRTHRLHTVVGGNGDGQAQSRRRPGWAARRRNLDEFPLRKRLSLASLDGSIVSLDSGVGSANYDSTSDQASGNEGSLKMTKRLSLPASQPLRLQQYHFHSLSESSDTAGDTVRDSDNDSPRREKRRSSSSRFAKKTVSSDKATSTDSLERRVQPDIRARDNSKPQAAATAVNNASSVTTATNSSSPCQFCSLWPRSSFDMKHPAIRSQYRNLLPPPMPKLGVSAVRSHRMSSSDLSLNSQASSSTSLDAVGLCQVHQAAASHGHARMMSDSIQQSLKLMHARQAKDQTADTKLPKPTADLSHGSDTQIPGLYENLPPQSQPEAAPHDSVTSMMQDHELLLQKPPMLQTPVNPPREVSQLQALCRLYGLPPNNHQQLQELLEGVVKVGGNGSILQQLVPLLQDCWKEHTAPSADEILRRLNVILSSASV